VKSSLVWADFVFPPINLWVMPTMKMKHAHYYKEFHGAIDVYRVLKLFNVTDPAIQHAVKKLLCAGDRGVKDQAIDFQEAVDSIERAIQMIEEEDAS